MNGHPERAMRTAGSAVRVLAGVAAMLAASPGICGSEPERAPSSAPLLAAPDNAGLDAVNAVTPLRYMRIPGSAFHPVSSGVAFGYDGGGCIHRSGAAAALFTHKIVLPQGSVVKYLRLYYNDASSSNISAFFTSYDQVGGFIEHTTVTSTDNTGFGSSLSPEIAYAVDQYVAPTVVTVNLNSSTDTSLQFCGIRVAYYDIADDTIFKSGFD